MARLNQIGTVVREMYRSATVGVVEGVLLFLQTLSDGLKAGVREYVSCVSCMCFYRAPTGNDDAASGNDPPAPCIRQLTTPAIACGQIAVLLSTFSIALTHADSRKNYRQPAWCGSAATC